jgi:hypothetical protein
LEKALAKLFMAVGPMVDKPKKKAGKLEKKAKSGKRKAGPTPSAKPVLPAPPKLPSKA